MNLKQKLEFHYKAFDRTKILPDPLQFLHLYKDELDVEVIGFIASIFAYGTVKQINNSLEKIREIVKTDPHNFVINFSPKDYKRFVGLKHRFYSENDILKFFVVLNQVYQQFGSLKNLFLSSYNSEDINLKNAISKFSYHLIHIVQVTSETQKVSQGIKFLFPLPEKGSACKRMNLFLRWMVRKDELDFGLWKEIPTSKLIIPVDTHIARISRLLKLTNRKNVSWQMAEEITQKLKKFDPVDPVKYDFALCHIGMRKMKF